MNYTQVFCRQIRTRSDEHKRAITLLEHSDMPSQIVAILRQELDSMIRVMYLLSLSDKSRRTELIQACVEGKYWTKECSRKKITDGEMLKLASKLHGWSGSVYRFGCGFIHLSRFHDYKEREPMDAISQEEKDNILRYMQYYHGGPHVLNLKFADLIPYLPVVFEKISGNLESYLQDLELGKSLDDDEY